MQIVLNESIPAQKLECFAYNRSPMTVLEEVWNGNSLLLMPNESIHLGKSNNALAYNPYAEISLCDGFTGLGLKVSENGLSNSDIVMTLWGKDRAIIPARVIQIDNRYSLELVEVAKNGERCFVVDEGLNNFITMSLESDGSDKVKILNPNAIDSWMVSAGSRAIRRHDGRFEVSRTGSTFSISDSKKKCQYVGSLVYDDDEIKSEHELAMIKRMLASKGLGSLLPIYSIKIVKGKNNES